MTFSIFVRNLKISKHMLDEYVIISLYFLNKNKNDNIIITKIIREIHFVDDLKTNMSIDNNLLSLKRFAIDVAKRFAYIESCDVTIDVDVKTTRIVVHERVHARKVVDVSSRSKMTISIHHIAISSDRDFLFKLNIDNFVIST